MASQKARRGERCVNLTFTSTRQRSQKNYLLMIVKLIGIIQFKFCDRQNVWRLNDIANKNTSIDEYIFCCLNSLYIDICIGAFQYYFASSLRPLASICASLQLY